MSSGASSETQTEGKEQPSKKQSCIPRVDELWFCYSPVHQLTEYYRFGNVDDCLGHWNRLYDCLKQRTKFADQEQEQRAPQHPLWQLRTKEEAQRFWQQEFGHLDTPGATPAREPKVTIKAPSSAR